MGLRIVVVGIPGVGKSTVVQKAESLIHGSKIMIFGTAMFEAAKKLGWVRHRDEMRKLPVQKQRRLQKLAAQVISRGKGGVVFVDTHLFIRTPEGFWPGLPSIVIEALRPTHLILVEATPQEVLSRRKNDTTRYRDEISLKEVASELTLARTFISSASLVSGAPISFLRNDEGGADKAAEVIRDLVKSALSK